MRYVGFSEYYHDAAISIINEDGTVEFASQAERFSKKKNDSIIPESLWDYVNDNDHVSFYEDFDLREKYREPYRGKKGKELHGDSVRSHVEIPIGESLVYDTFHEHHISHCATAFYTRPWEDKEDTVMVSIDGAGEYQTAVIYDHNFNLIKEWHYPKSIGLVYTSATKTLGLRPLEDEYVVMGLSSYGTAPSEMVQWLIDWWEETPDVAAAVAGNTLLDSPDAVEGEGFQKMRFRLIEFREQYEDADFAAGIQKFAEYGIMQIMNIARQHGNKLVYSGGCAQNVVINSMIHELFDGQVHIAVAPTDAGSSLGTAAMTWAKETGKDQLCWSPYSGYNIDREVNVQEVVDHLLEHKVCGLANGKAEFGPRALGNRSLIADVRYDVKDTVNTIKRRQKYRPFAPAILEEHAEEYFSGPMNEYMQYTSIAKHPYTSVTHVDGTARVQIVKKDCPSIFRKVIEEYYARTGVPMLLNTSLNIRGRPMVNDEHDAELWEQKYGVKVF
jgi:carbamoyltransferase